MAIAITRRTTFIRRSVQTCIGNSLTTATGNVYTVVYGAPGGIADPDSASNDVTAPLRAWALVTWPIEQAGKRGASIMQVDIYYRFGAVTGGAGSDPYRQECAEIVDAITTIFSGLKPNGVLRAFVPLLDFTVPTVPTDTGECLICQNTRAAFGECEDVRDLPDEVENGMWHTIARWRFVGPQDVIGPAGFYTA